jgi:hypothetical protein
MNKFDHMNKEELKNFALNNIDNFAIQLKRHYPQIYNEIDKLYDFPKFCEKLFVYVNEENSIGKCKICGKKTEFNGYWKRYREYCSCKCRSKDKSDKANEIRNCIICGKEFRIYKKREKTTCSQKCLFKLGSTKGVNDKRQKSMKETMIKKYGVNHASKLPNFGNIVKQTKLRNYGNPNYMNSEKSKQTRLEKYGNKNYNNTEKNKQTCLKRYGVPNVFNLLKNKTNGKQISKFQKREYEKILKQYPDALLEEYLKDVQKSVDIYIPSEKKIVECFGDFWHCNPSMYSPEYYHKYIHMNANEIWKKDDERIQSFKNAGYQVEVIWENTNKKFKHSTLS